MNSLKKKLSSTIMAVIMTISAINIAVFADINDKSKIENSADTVIGDSSGIVPDENSFSYRSNGNNIAITAYTGENTNVVIPAQIESKTVTQIDRSAFIGCSQVETITFPSTISTMETLDLTDCVNFKAIYVDEENKLFKSINNIITSSDNTVLYSVYDFETREFTLPQDIVSIKPAAFINCTKLQTITLNDNSAYTIDGNALYYENTLQEFYNNSATSYTIPDYVTAISGYCFYKEPLLTQVIIPQNVTSISQKAFYNANNTATTYYLFKGSYADKFAQENNISYAYIIDINDCAIALNPDTYTYTGAEIIPNITISDGNKELLKDADYTLSYKNNIIKGTATITVKGKGIYTGSCTRTFTINAKSISNLPASLSTSSYTYNGSAKKPKVTISGLTQGVDFDVTYSSNVKAGTGKAIITGKNNYCGSKTLTFTIKRKSISTFKAVLSTTTYTYTGTQKKPNVTISGLKVNTDFTITYAKNTNAGTATVTITGKGNYTGTLTKTFTIKKKAISSCSSFKLSTSKYIYTGTEKRPSVTIKYGTKTLVKGTDFTISYTNNKNTGRGTVTVTGKGNYTGKKTLYIQISPKKITGVKVTSQTTSTINISWTKSAGSVTGYEVYRAKGLGSYRKIATITGASKNFYFSTKLATAANYNFRIRAYKVINGTKIYGEYSAILKTSTKTTAPKTTLTTGSKKVTIKWSRVTSATGYEVYYSAKSTTGFKKFASTTKLSAVKSALTKGKTYYFKVRAYKTVNGVKIYSTYSTVKKITVK